MSDINTNIEFPFYIRTDHKYPYYTTFAEIQDGSWVSIRRVNTVDNVVMFEVTKMIEETREPYGWKWWESPDHRCTKKEFDDAKYEFLNWVDKTFKR